MKKLLFSLLIMSMMLTIMPLNAFAESAIRIGDIDSDGNIGSMDYLYLKRAYFSQYNLSSIAVGDIDSDGSISSMDYLYLKRAYFSQYVITNDDIIVDDSTSTPVDDLEWTYINGGDDYIIKTNGKTDIEIPVDISIYDIPEDDPDGYYVIKTIVKRSNFQCIDGWIYFNQDIHYYNDYIKDTPTGNYPGTAGSTGGGAVRMREDGSELQSVGYGICFIAGYNENIVYVCRHDTYTPFPEFGTLYRMDLSNGIEDGDKNKVKIDDILIPTSSYYKDGILYCEFDSPHPISGEEVEDWEINLADYE